VTPLTSPGRNTQEPEGQQHADVQQHRDDEGRPGQNVVVREEDEGRPEAKARSQVFLQSEVLLSHRRPARRVLTRMKERRIFNTASVKKKSTFKV